MSTLDIISCYYIRAGEYFIQCFFVLKLFWLIICEIISHLLSFSVDTRCHFKLAHRHRVCFHFNTEFSTLFSFVSIKCPSTLTHRNLLCYIERPFMLTSISFHVKNHHHFLLTSFMQTFNIQPTLVTLSCWHFPKTIETLAKNAAYYPRTRSAGDCFCNTAEKSGSRYLRCFL
jgi:hypothetical protein